MTTQRRITRPGPYDNEFMTVTCTPDKTAVEFFELLPEAEGAARLNLHPTVTAYVGQILKQGEHNVRGTSSHIAILVEVDDELRRALAYFQGAQGRPPREKIAKWLTSILDERVKSVREAYRSATDDETTQPGTVPVK